MKGRQICLRGQALIIAFALIMAVDVALSASSEPSRDDVGGQEDVLVKIPLLELQVYHPSLDIFVNSTTVEIIRHTTVSVLNDAFLELDQTYVGCQYKSISLDITDRKESRRLGGNDKRRALFGTSLFHEPSPPSCPCTTFVMEGNVSFSFADALPATINNSSHFFTNSGNHTNTSIQRPRAESIGRLIHNWLKDGSPKSETLQNGIQTAFGEVDGVHSIFVRLVEPMEASYEFPPPAFSSAVAAEELSAKPTRKPTSMHSTTSPSPPPIPEDVMHGPMSTNFNNSLEINDAHNDSSDETDLSSLVSGTLAGAIVFAFLLCALRVNEYRKRRKLSYVSPEEEIVFYPADEKLSPPSFEIAPEDATYKFGSEDLLVALGSDGLFDDVETQKFNQEHGNFEDDAHYLSHPNSTMKPNRAHSRMSGGPSRHCAGTFGESWRLSHHAQQVGPDGFFSNSRVGNSSFDANFRPAGKVGQVEQYSRPALQFGPGSPFEDVNTFTHVHGQSDVKLTPTYVQFGRTPTQQERPRAVEKPAARIRDGASSPFRSLATLEKEGDEGGDAADADDATATSFHSSVESVDSLISSCWDPNDNDNDNGEHNFCPEGNATPRAPTASSGPSDDISFCQHVSFMQGTSHKEPLASERTRYVGNEKIVPPRPTKPHPWKSNVHRNITTPAASHPAEPPGSLPQNKTANNSKQWKHVSLKDSPFLSVSMSDSTEEFDEFGFRVVSSNSFT